jgi:hypothetical protein
MALRFLNKPVHSSANFYLLPCSVRLEAIDRGLAGLGCREESRPENRLERIDTGNSISIPPTSPAARLDDRVFQYLWRDSIAPAGTGCQVYIASHPEPYSSVPDSVAGTLCYLGPEEAQASSACILLVVN